MQNFRQIYTIKAENERKSHTKHSENYKLHDKKSAKKTRNRINIAERITQYGY